MPITNNDKIMDLLAKVLQCHSNCVAIANIGEQFVIAANEFTKDTQENDPQYLLIKSIMNYFKHIAITGNSDEHMRDDLMFKIHEARSRAKGLEIYGDVRKFIINDKTAIKQFINSSRMRENKEKVPSRKECKSFPREGNLHMKIAATYTDMRDIFNCIFAIEDSILRGKKGDFYNPNKLEVEYKITSEQLSAFQNFNDRYDSGNILFHELRKVIGSTHAEMQILADLILKKINKPTYIGTSKRCCFNCDCMIIATNETLTYYGRNLKINTDDSHLGAFTDTWNIPRVFRLGDKKILELFSAIEEKYREIYTTKTPSLIYNMEHSEKSTPRSVANLAKDYLESQTKAKEIFKKFSDSEESTLQGNLEIIDYSIKLYNSGIFNILFSMPINDEQYLKEAAVGFYAEVIGAIATGNLPEKANSELLQKFLKTTAVFPDIEQKEKIIEVLLSQFDAFREKIQQEENKKQLHSQETTRSTDRVEFETTSGLVFSTNLNSTAEVQHGGLVEPSSSHKIEETSPSEQITQMHMPLAMPYPARNLKPKPKPKGKWVPKI